jgi:hypothetical protein
MNEYDPAARYGAKLDPPGFLSWLLAGLDPDLRFERWLDTQTIPFPGEPDRRCDTVAELVSASGTQPPWALVSEFQSRPDPDIGYRLLEYLGRLGRELRHGPYQRDRYLLTAILINLTEASEAAILVMAYPGPDGPELKFRPRIRNLARESAADTLAGIADNRIAPCVLIWVPLMDGGAKEDNLKEWKRLALAETDRKRRSEYGGLALLFSELAGRDKEWKKLLENWDMEESQVVAEWVAKGEKRGEERGLKKGLEQGLRLLQDKLLRLLETRFGGSVPPDVTSAVRVQSDMDRLSKWFDAALVAPTLEQFRENLQGDSSSSANGA